MGTFYNKLLLLKDNKITLFQWPEGLTDHLLPCLYDSQKRIWAKTWYNGIYCYVNDKWVKYDKNNSGLQSNKFGNDGTTIIEDRNGAIIAVSEDDSNDSSGIFTFSGNSWKRSSVDPGVSYYNSIKSIALDSSGALWLGTLKGLVRIKGDSLYKYTMTDIMLRGAPDGFIRDIVVDESNRVYFATYHYGVYILDQNDNFSCKDNQHVEITSPPENSQFQPSDTLVARWDSYGFSDSVLLQYRKSNGTWLPCYSVIANPNRRNQFFYRWVIQSTLTPGTYIFRVSDSCNKAAYDTITFSIAGESQNIPPVFVSIPDTLKANQNTTTTYALSATDADKDSLSFQALPLPLWITFNDSTLTIVPDGSSTTQTITVIVSDGNGGSDTAKIVVVPVPPVANSSSSKNYNFQKSIRITSTKYSIDVTFETKYSNEVRNAVLFDYSGKQVAGFSTVNSGFILDRSVIKLSTGIYHCIVYSKDGKVVFKKSLQILE